MKRLFLIIAMFLMVAQVGAYGIYNNSGTVAADSLTISFFALDSAGNMVDMASGDSVFFQVHYPEGAMAFEDSGSYDGTGLDGSLVSNDFSTQTMYYYSDALADIDGTPVQGTYTWAIMVKDLTGAAITTVKTGTFQLVTESDFNLSLEYIKDVLDTLQNHDDWVAHQSTSDSILDSTNVSMARTTTAGRTIDVAATGEVGVDLSNINGTLDVGEIGDNAITAAKIAADAIGASELATTAADEIADEAWDEVLNVGGHNVALSAGKRLRELDAGGAIAEGTAQDGAATWILLAAAEPNTSDWYNACRITILAGTGENQSRMIEGYANDTAYLATSDDWITAPDNTSEYQIQPFGAVHVADIHAPALATIIDSILGMAVADTTTGKFMAVLLDLVDKIADSTFLYDGRWDSVLAALTNAAILAKPVNVGQISGDATAADQLEGMFESGTRAGLFLTTLDIRSTSDSNAITAYGNGSGNGVAAKGGATNAHGILTTGQGGGNGLYAIGGATGKGGYFRAGASGGVGFKVLGVGTGIGMEVTGGATNGDGLQINAQGTGKDIDLSGDGTIDGTINLSATAINSIWNEISLAGVVEDSTGNTTTMVQTNLAEATDNHYNGMMVYFIDGDEAVTARRITDYDGTNGYIVYDPATTATPAAGDSIRILSWASVDAAATVSASDIVAIADTILNRDTTDVATAGSFGAMLKDTSAYQGGAAGLDSGKVYEVLTQWLLVDSNKIKLAQFIIGGDNDDSASFLVYNSGTSPAVFFHGFGDYPYSRGLLVRSDSGTGAKFETLNKVAAGTADGSTQAGLWADAFGPYGTGFLATNNNESDTCIGAGTIIRSSGSGHGLTISVGDPTSGDTTTHNCAINVEGRVAFYSRAGRDEDAFTIQGRNDGYGVYIRADNNPGLKISNSGGGDTSIVLGGSIQFGADQGITGYVDSVRAGVAVTQYGSGIYACTLWAIDSSVTNDSARSRVEIEITDASGNPVVNPTTETDGSVIAWLNAGTYDYVASSQRQVWGDGSFTLSAADSVAMLGYSTYTLYVVSAPGNTNLCMVYGTVRGNNQELVKGARVTIIPPTDIKNICDSSFIAMDGNYITGTGPWNGYSNGYFADTVLKSSCMSDSTLEYTLLIQKDDFETTLKFSIPSDSGSYHVTGFSD